MAQVVVVMGKGTLAIQVAEWFQKSQDHDLVEIVPVMPEPTWTESLRDWATSAGVSVVDSGRHADLAFRGRLDLVFSVFYDKIIPPEFINRCERILNLHNGPLPRYRGVSPINWALKTGENSHGVTIHEITEGIDDGPIISQVVFPLYPEFDEVVDAYRRALVFGWTLFQETMPLLDRIQPRPQDGSKASYYSTAENELLGERRHFTRQESRFG